MRARDKQNKHRLKFQYIEHLKMLGKIWKEYASQLDATITKVDEAYPLEVISLMDDKVKKEFCSILDKCDDIGANISKIDTSLKSSHKNFSKYKKIMLESNKILSK